MKRQYAERTERRGGEEGERLHIIPGRESDLDTGWKPSEGAELKRGAVREGEEAKWDGGVAVGDTGVGGV